jgi:hypothetical protein
LLDCVAPIALDGARLLRVSRRDEWLDATRNTPKDGVNAFFS